MQKSSLIEKYRGEGTKRKGRRTSRNIYIWGQLEEEGSKEGFIRKFQNRLNTCSVCQKFKFLTVVSINASIYLPWFFLQDCKYLINVTHNIHLSWLFIIHLQVTAYLALVKTLRKRFPAVTDVRKKEWRCTLPP